MSKPSPASANMLNMSSEQVRQSVHAHANG